MKRLTALILTLILTMSLFTVAFAEGQSYANVQFDASLTAELQESLDIADSADWLSNDLYIALLATVLPLDVILDNDIDLDVSQYKIVDAYVGENETGIMTVLYRGTETPTALILSYGPASSIALLTVVELESMPNDSDLENAMKDTNTRYFKVDADSAATINQIFQDVLSGTAE